MAESRYILEIEQLPRTVFAIFLYHLMNSIFFSPSSTHRCDSSTKWLVIFLYAVVNMSHQEEKVQMKQNFTVLNGICLIVEDMVGSGTFVFPQEGPYV